jgi:hypothetical protein
VPAKWVRTATGIELELYVANPTSGFRFFEHYDRYARTNEGLELVMLARLEIDKRRRRSENVKWGVTTLVALAALATSVVSCIDKQIAWRPDAEMGRPPH